MSSKRQNIFEEETGVRRKEVSGGDERRQLCGGGGGDHGGGGGGGGSKLLCAEGASMSATAYGSVVYQLNHANIESSSLCDFLSRAVGIVYRTVIGDLYSIQKCLTYVIVYEVLLFELVLDPTIRVNSAITPSVLALSNNIRGRTKGTMAPPPPAGRFQLLGNSIASLRPTETTRLCPNTLIANRIPPPANVSHEFRLAAVFD
ncbi:hypothetical protein AAG570_009174 [Ranatra chinensis]|uniref:Uncharacterized protein n=1 Tax=Ranatra chinensis TaxID=642074 RepID=A0ABD0YV62_9HEMI